MECWLNFSGKWKEVGVGLTYFDQVRERIKWVWDFYYKWCGLVSEMGQRVAGLGFVWNWIWFYVLVHLVCK